MIDDILAYCMAVLEMIYKGNQCHVLRGQNSTLPPPPTSKSPNHSRIPNCPIHSTDASYDDIPIHKWRQKHMGIVVFLTCQNWHCPKHPLITHPPNCWSSLVLLSIWFYRCTQSVVFTVSLDGHTWQFRLMTSAIDLLFWPLRSTPRPSDCWPITASMQININVHALEWLVDY